MRRIAGFLAAAAIVAACIGGGDGGSDEPRTPSPEYIAAAERAATAALLTLEDAPAGWASAPQDDEDVDFEFTGECAKFNNDGPSPGEVAFAESDELSAPEGQSVSSDASVFEREEAAKEALADDFDAIFGQCRTQFKDLFIAGIREVYAENDVDPATVDVEVLLQDASFPEQGDDSRALRLRLRASAPDDPAELTIVFDVASIRVGAIVGGLFYAAIEPNDVERDAFAATMARKLAAAAAELPE